jgi:hypothetical protein
MRFLLLVATGFAALAFTPLQAAPVDPLTGMAQAPVEAAQYVYGGRRFCWYPDGWKGPGWYRCGFHRRHGYGWGGPMGWQGWAYGPRVYAPRVYAPRVRPGPRYYRRH